jgi:hypothetical protein
MPALDELARSLGGLRWAELRWFEVLGTWMRDQDDPEVKVAFARSCQRRATHAGLIGERLPTYATGTLVNSPQQATVPGAGTAELVAPAAAGGTAARVTAFYGVALPRMIVEYGALLAATDARTDGPTHRLLSLVTADDTDELARGDQLARRFSAG